MATSVLRVGYRPLRIGFLVRPNSLVDVRETLQLTSLLWGGAFNTLIPLQGESEVDADIEALRLDALVPIRESAAATAVVKRHRYLHWPLVGDAMLAEGGQRRLRALDALPFVQRLAAEQPSREPKLVAAWQQRDPYAAVFAATFGDFARSQELLGEDLRALFVRATGALEDAAPAASLGVDSAVTALSLLLAGLEWRVSFHVSTARQGVFLGNPRSVGDICAFWNLRACGADCLFWDVTSDGGPFRLALERRIESLRESPDLDARPFHGFPCLTRTALRSPAELPPRLRELLVPPLPPALWPLRAGHGHSPWRELVYDELPALPPQSVLAHVDEMAGERSRVVIQLPPAPAARQWPLRQDVVATVHTYGDSGYRGTLRLPPLRELNEWYRVQLAAAMHPVRADDESFGVVVDSGDETLELWPLEQEALLARVFERGSITARRSRPGGLAWQVLQQFGGLAPARILRIPGVRALLASTKARVGMRAQRAIELIKDDGSFAAAEPLYVAAERLGPSEVFAVLTRRRIFLPGLWLECPRCRQAGFYPARELDDDVRCSRCARGFALGPALIGNPVRFRLSGLLEERGETLSASIKDPQPAAIPVLLTLLFLREWALADSLVLEVNHDLVGDAIEPCEADVVAMSYGGRPRAHPHLLLGECKGKGAVDAVDVRKLGTAAAAIRRSGIACDLLFATTRDSFTEDEMALFRNYYEQSSQHPRLRRAVILLTRRELDRGAMALDDKGRYGHAGLEGLVAYSRDRHFEAAEV